MIKSCDHQSSFICFEEADECVRVVSSSCVDSVFVVRPQRASELAVCTRLGSPRDCRCCGTK